MEGPEEGARLEQKTQPRFTRQLLRLIDLRPGMRVLDAGAGTGAVAREMARVVGPEGSVVALDASADRLRQGARLTRGAALEFVVGDVYAPPVQPASFDLVWSRFLFEYLEEPARALEGLIRCVRPGGRVVVADLDGNGAFHHPTPPRLARQIARLQTVLEGRFDPFIGRKLFHLFRQAGLDEVRARVVPYHTYGGVISADHLSNWRAKLEGIRGAAEKAMGGARAYGEFVRSFLQLLQDPDTFSYSVLIVVEGARRPETDPWPKPARSKSHRRASPRSFPAAR